MNAIARAIQIVGGPAKLAGHLNVTYQAVCFWRDGKRALPADHCPTIERLTGGEVRCEDLLPDVEWSVLRESCSCDCSDAVS